VPSRIQSKARYFTEIGRATALALSSFRTITLSPATGQQPSPA